jgi:hypothetical protein
MQVGMSAVPPRPAATSKEQAKSRKTRSPAPSTPKFARHSSEIKCSTSEPRAATQLDWCNSRDRALESQSMQLAAVMHHTRG